MQIETKSAAATRRAAAAMAAQLQPGAVLALYGPIGAGKTCFVQGLARGLGIRRAVTSPTFIIANEYPGRLPLYHLDLYRLQSTEEVLAAGLDEYLLRPGITAIEWPERAEDILPQHAIRVVLQTTGRDSRRMVVSGLHADIAG